VPQIGNEPVGDVERRRGNADQPRAEGDARHRQAIPINKKSGRSAIKPR
jgi:hypothetical protein